MSESGSRSRFLYDLHPSVRWEFCRVMDGLSDLDWTHFASEVLGDQTDVQLAERRVRRTDWVMVHLENRNRTVDYLSNVLQRLHLLRPRDIILSLSANQSPSSPQFPLPVTPSLFDPPPKKAPPNFSSLSTAVYGEVGGAKALPGPAPPPSYLQSAVQQEGVNDDITNPVSGVTLNWPFEEVHAGTEGFSSKNKVGEGGFGEVYRALLRSVQCAVKRFRRADQSENCLLDWTQLRESFRTEVEKLSKFRHPNVVDLMGFSEGCGEMCLIYSFMENRSLDHQLHNECVPLSWTQRIGVVEEASAALHFLHSSPEPLIHGDVKSSNILLDGHMVAKLSDFGLARFSSRGVPGVSATQTASLGQTGSLRGTLAYLPDDYLRNRVLSTTVDVFSFGVVLLEVLSGRRAVDKDRTHRDTYLKDVVRELDEPWVCEGRWRRELDERLTAGGAAEPLAWQRVAALAWKTLNSSRKKRPAMMEVWEELREIRGCVRTPSVSALCQQISRLEPSEDTYSHPSSSSSSSSNPPHPLLCSSSSSPPPPPPALLCSSSSSPPPPPLLCSSSLPPLSSSSLIGPCETDESRGFSFSLQSDHEQIPQPRTDPDPESGGQRGGQRSSVGVNLSEQRLVEEEAGTGSAQLLSSNHLYGGGIWGNVGGPEETDELDILRVMGR